MSEKLSCTIVDDEPVGLQLIEAYLEKIPQVKHIASFTDAVSVLKFLGTHHTDILITDIQMPGLNGLDMVKSLPVIPEVIFTTAHRDFAVEGFDVNAVDFLLKPLTFARFQTAIARARERLQSRWIIGRPKNDFLFVKQDHGYVKVSPEDIGYLEGMGDYVKLHLANGDHLVTRRTLTDLHDQLSPDKFIRVHKSFIVNLAMIATVQSAQITLTNAAKIPIAKSYKPVVIRKIGLG